MFVMSFITLLQGKGILLFPCFFKEKAYVTYRPDAQRVAFYGLLYDEIRLIIIWPCGLLLLTVADALVRKCLVELQQWRCTPGNDGFCWMEIKAARQ